MKEEAKALGISLEGKDVREIAQEVRKQKNHAYGCKARNRHKKQVPF